MSRKSLILCLSAMAFLLLGLGVAIAVLYSGTGNGEDGRRSEISFSGSRECLKAVPSDAVLVSCFDRTDQACKGPLAVFDFPSTLGDRIADGSLESLKRAHLAVSLHYSGKLTTLYVLENEDITDAALSSLKGLLDQEGLHYQSTEDFILISESETLLMSASRHLDREVSVADAPGFDEAVSSVEGDDILLMSNLHFHRLLTSAFTKSLTRHSSFVERFSDWFAFELDDNESFIYSMVGRILFDNEPDEFMTVLERGNPAVSEIADVLPSYTFSYLSLPMRNVDEYMSAYRTYLDSRQGLQSFTSRQERLGKQAGIMPEDFFKNIQIREIGSASFICGSKIEKLNLMNIGSKDESLIFKGNPGVSFRGYVPAVHSWAYPSFAGSVFGNLFTLDDESCFTYIDGWIITGSRIAIEEYVDRAALEYTLNEYLADAGASGLLDTKPSLLTSYVSFTESPQHLSSFVSKQTGEMISYMSAGSDISASVLSIGKEKEQITISTGVCNLTLEKTKAPAYDRDTTVVVPTGPFKVKNSHTGKVNTFYQNKQLAICLRDENGKDMWGVPLGKPICGTAQNVDFYANGRLQVIFGAGSSIYIIDRLGRYVNGFPMDLGKKIVLGPDVYDFSGARRYNIMVLHDDNTIQMYNLKGKKPDAWKGITASETIKALPERLTLAGSDFWIVRTSLQTLIFPFYGGAPITTFEGDERIKPDSEVEAVDGQSVKVSCYDGKQRTVKLK